MSLYDTIINMIIKEWIDENPDIVLYNTNQELRDMADSELKFIIKQADEHHGIRTYRTEKGEYRR